MFSVYRFIPVYPYTDIPYGISYLNFDVKKNTITPRMRCVADWYWSSSSQHDSTTSRTHHDQDFYNVNVVVWRRITVFGESIKDGRYLYIIMCSSDKSNSAGAKYILLRLKPLRRIILCRHAYVGRTRRIQTELSGRGGEEMTQCFSLFRNVNWQSVI